MAKKSCDPLQASIEWCQGKPEPSGVQNRVYYTAKSNVATWAGLERDEFGRLTSNQYKGNFQMVEGKKFHYVDINPDKSKFSSESVGEWPNQMQSNKADLVIPGIGPEESMIANYTNNVDCLFLVPDRRGRIRVFGAEKIPTTCTTAQDGGEGATGTVSTTVSISAPDEGILFYTGEIDAEDGVSGAA